MSDEEKNDIQGELDAFYVKTKKRWKKKCLILFLGLGGHILITTIALELVFRGAKRSTAEMLIAGFFSMEVVAISLGVLILVLTVIFVLRHNIDWRQREDLEALVKKMKGELGYSRKEAEQCLANYPNKEEAKEVLDLVFDGKKKESK